MRRGAKGSLAAFLAAAALVPATVFGGDPPRRVGVSDDPMPVYSGAAEDYTRTCEGCHLPDGSGIPGLVPRMNDFVGLFLHVPGGREFVAQVPGVSLARLDDERLTAVLNWTLLTFSAAELPAGHQPYSVDEIRRLRREPLNQVAARRAALIDMLRERGLLRSEDDGIGPRVMR